MRPDNEKIRNYEQQSFFEKKESKDINPMNIFFAVLAAILVSWFMREAYIEWQLRQVLSTFNQEMKLIEVQSQLQINAVRMNSEAIKSEEERNSRIKAAELMQKKLDAQQVEFNKRADVVAEINNRVKKEEAWLEFYQPTKGCEQDNQNREAVKCGNDYIKAHKRFEASWVASPI